MNTNNATHDYSNLPQLDLVSTLNSLNHLSNIDPDGNLLIKTNLKYYTTRKFATDHLIKSCTTSSNFFSTFHAIIKSMNVNFDNFTHLYGKFNMRFTGVKVWNSIDKLKTLKMSAFKKKLRDSLIAFYITS